MTTIEQISQIQSKYQPKLMKKMNVIGVGIGFKETKGQVTEQLSLVVLVKKKKLLSKLASKDIIPLEIKGIVTDVKEVGNIIIHGSSQIEVGDSIAHYLSSIDGTFAAVVRDVSSKAKLILSSNHILANWNNAEIGDAILHPSPIAGGMMPQDRIAELERFIHIHFDGNDDENGERICPIAKGASGFANVIANIVGSKSRLIPMRIDQTANEADAAVAKPLNDNDITDVIPDIGVVNDTCDPELNMEVKKRGRTTGITTGIIQALNVTVQIGFGGGKTALFKNQIITGNMSQPGDSACLLVESSTNKAVGLSLAGSDTTTVWSPIMRVMELMNINFG